MNLFKYLVSSFIVLVFLLAANAANAEGGSGGNDALITKVEPIIVNLMGPTPQFIQIEMVLKLAKPEIGEKTKLYMPVIRHKMILMLSTRNASQLSQTEGKQKLVDEAKAAINQSLGLSDKDGVTDVLFSSFIIQ